MSDNNPAARSDAEPATPTENRARPAQRKLLILALILLIVAVGKIYYDRDGWWQALEPPRENPGGPLMMSVAEGFHPIQVVPGPREAITDAPFVTAEQADELLSEAELVLGVVVGDEARAYPINMLTGPAREIINDTLAGRAIAATW